MISGLLLAQVGGVARAQEDGAEGDAGEEVDETDATTTAEDAVARDRFRRGTAFFDAGDYEEAAREFEAAYDLSRHPELLFNVYLAHERLGNLAQAIAALEGYLNDGDPGERREALTSRRDRLRERLDEDRREEEEARAAREQELREAASSSGPGAMPWIIAGSGLAVAAVGVVLLLVSAGDIQAVEEPGPSPMWSDVESQYDRAPVLSTIGGIALGVGAAALLTGLTWGLLTLGGADDDATEVVIGPTGLGVRGRF
jgi:tetratricopeptide (TPR) repeat protein